MTNQNDVTQALEALDSMWLIAHNRTKNDNTIQGDNTVIKNCDKTIRQALEQMQWRPIETAPKDVNVLVYCEGVEGEVSYEIEEPTIVKAHKYSDDYWVATDTDYYEVTLKNPTHWMPIPFPPKEG